MTDSTLGVGFSTKKQVGGLEVDGLLTYREMLVGWYVADDREAVRSGWRYSQSKRNGYSTAEVWPLGCQGSCSMR